MGEVALEKLAGWLDRVLGVAGVPGDDSNNGLQVEGMGRVRRACFGVDACAALFERAIQKKADFVFVHHGLSWRDSLKRLSGMNARRIGPLFRAGISLYAAHLPLDAHPEFGHNAMIAKMLSLKNKHFFANYHGVDIGVCGELPKAMTLGGLADLVDGKLSKGIAEAVVGGRVARKGVCYTLGDKACSVKRIGVISGGAGLDGLMAAAAKRLDCLIVGEFGHTCYHAAVESGVAIIAPGHYKTETPGVIEIMRMIKKKFEIECEFVDIPTGL